PSHCERNCISSLVTPSKWKTPANGSRFDRFGGLALLRKNAASGCIALGSPFLSKQPMKCSIKPEMNETLQISASANEGIPRYIGPGGCVLRRSCPPRDEPRSVHSISEVDGVLRSAQSGRGLLHTHADARQAPDQRGTGPALYREHTRAA